MTLKRHIMKRKGYSLTILNTIDWDGVELAGKSLSVRELTWLMKHVARYNSVGRQLKQRQYWIDSKCPRCNAPNEDSTHVVFCSLASAVATFTASLRNLKISTIMTFNRVLVFMLSNSNLEWKWDHMIELH